MRQGHVVALLILSVLLLVSTVAVTTTSAEAGSTDEQGCIDPRPDIRLQYGVSVPRAEADVTGVLYYDNSTQTLTITYHNLSTIDEFWVNIPTRHINRGFRILNATGFNNLSTDSAYSYQWDGKTEPPRLTITIISRQPEEGEQHEYAATPSWGFFPVPNHSPATNLSFSSHGFVGDQFILAGPNTVHTTSAGCQDIRLIVPQAANLSESPGSIVESLATASKKFEAGPRYTHINVYALPDPIRRGGAAETNEFWVHESSTFKFGSEFVGGVIPANTWLHEYTHTRQHFDNNDSIRLGEGMWWFTEASATYYSVELTTRQRYAGPCDYTYYFWNLSRTRMGNVVLSNQSTWGPYDQGQYRKGAIVLSALDMRIRNETNGKRTLDDVFRRMNTHNGTITYVEFKRIVADVSGTSLDKWLDERITTSQHFEPGLRENACRWQLAQNQLFHTDEGRILLGLVGLTVVVAGYRVYLWLQQR